MAAYGLGRAPYPGVGGYSGECVLFVRLGGTRSLFTRLRLKMREEKRLQRTKSIRRRTPMELSKVQCCSPSPSLFATTRSNECATSSKSSSHSEHNLCIEITSDNNSVPHSPSFFQAHPQLIVENIHVNPNPLLDTQHGARIRPQFCIAQCRTPNQYT